MRSLKHWTFKYINDRIREKWFRFRNPDLPWLTPTSISFLDQFLKPTDIGLEFGSGRSTLWFANKVSKLFSVEHDNGWYEKIKQHIQKNSIDNVIYHHISLEEMTERMVPAYVEVINSVNDNTLDFVLVDGKYRDFCATSSITKLKSKGLLIIDNADVYLPSDCDTPNSRKMINGTSSPEWDRFNSLTENWRRYWTCNGVSATAIFFKP